MVPLKRSTNAFCCGLPFFDEGGLHSLLAQPAGQAVGDELASVVGAQHLGPAVLVEEPFQFLDHLAGADRAGDTAAEPDSCVLVDDVEDPDRASVASAGAVEVVRRDVVRPLRGQTPDRLLGRALGSFSRGLAAPGRHAVPLQAPQPLDPLTVHAPALVAE